VSSLAPQRPGTGAGSVAAGENCAMGGRMPAAAGADIGFSGLPAQARALAAAARAAVGL